MSEAKKMSLARAAMHLAGEAREYSLKAARAKTQKTRDLHQSGAEMCEVVLDELERLQAENKALRSQLIDEKAEVTP